MKKTIAIVLLTLTVSALASSQAAKSTQTICKGEAIPEGYTIIGESASPNCPNNAWVIKQKGTPKLTMQEPQRSVAAPNSEEKAEGVEASSATASNQSAVAFAKRAFDMLVTGDAAVVEMIDFENLKLDGKDFGPMLTQMAAAAGKDIESVRREMIAGFSAQYRTAGEGPLTRWRIHSQNDDGVTVAANTTKGLIILFTVSERDGKQIITALSETR
jgi:hypothetical protein